MRRTPAIVTGRRHGLGVEIGGSTQRILVTGPERGPVARLQRELRSAGYQVQAALGLEEAAEALGSGPIHAAVVIAEETSPKEAAAGERHGLPTKARSPRADEVDRQAQNTYSLCHALKPVARARGVPLLLIAPLWTPGALAQSLESGADSVLFAPYQQPDVMGVIRGALLNGPLIEPEQELPEIVVVQDDRRHNVSAGRARLARLSFSIFEQLQHSQAALGWAQAELEELRQQLRQEREQARLALMLPDAVQGIAHDFSNLLETIGAATTVLRTNPAHPVPYRDAMDAALAQAASLIGSLQNWGHSDDAEAEAVDVAEVVREVLEAALLPLRAPNIRVRTQVEGLSQIWTSQSLLFRSLNNLVWNAVQAMPEGGLLSIIGYERRRRITLEVGDTGTGIAEQSQEKIFNPQFSTKEGHRGIGLFLVRSLVRRGGGEITFASRPGRGSIFAISFPAVGPEPKAPRPARAASRRLVRHR